MPIFEVDANGKTFEVDAPDMNTAAAALKNYKPEPAQEKPVFSGGILPFSRYANGDVRFDPNAGILGAIKSGLTLGGDVITGKARLPSSGAVPGSVEFGDPESAGQRVADMAALAFPASPATRGVGVNTAATKVVPPPTGPLGVTLSEGQATRDLAAIQREQAALRSGNPRAQAFADQQAGEVAGARNRISQGFDQFGQTIAETPQEAGQLVQSAVQREAASRKAGVTQAYDEARALPGDINAGYFEGMGQRIKMDLSKGDNPIVIDDKLTPWASEAIKDVENRIAQIKIQNRADIHNNKAGMNAGFDTPDIAGVNLNGVDQMRRRLSTFRNNAWKNNDVDGRAASAVVDAFDAQIDNAINSGAFNGDPRAVQAWNIARAAHADYKSTFGKQGGDPVGRIVERILGTKNNPAAIPNDVADFLYGSSGVNPSSLNVAVTNRVKGILGESSPEWSAVQQGLFQRIIDGPGRVEKRIDRFFTDGKEMSEAVFSPVNRSLIKQYADLHRALAVPQAGANWSNTSTFVAPLLNKIGNGVAAVIGAAIGHVVAPDLHGVGEGIGAAAMAKVSSSIKEAAQTRRIAKQMPLAIESAEKWQRALVRYEKIKTPATEAGLQVATTNLARAMKHLGVDIQSPGAVRADDQPEIPRPPGQ